MSGGLYVGRKVGRDRQLAKEAAMSDAPSVEQRLGEVEERLRRIEEHLGLGLTGPNAQVVVTEGDITSAAEAEE